MGGSVVGRISEITDLLNEPQICSETGMGFEELFDSTIKNLQRLKQQLDKKKETVENGCKMLEEEINIFNQEKK